MEELQVVVNQQPGVIQWNFEDLKKALQAELADYENVVYDDSAITLAKKDVASLRKLKKSVDDKRKEIKAKCMEPYEMIENQAKELTGLIDRPIELITKQINDYETAQREERKKAIIDYMNDAFADLPEDIQKKAQMAIYDTRWENASARVADWKQAVENEHEQIKTALGVIAGVDEDFRDVAMQTYKANLSLPDAMAKVQELQIQRDIILERQKQKEEQERKRREAAEAQKNEQPIENQKKNTEVENSAKTTHNIVLEDEPEEGPASKPDEGPQTITIQNPNDSSARKQASATIYLYDANGGQIKKVVDYIRFMGITCDCEVAK